MSDSLLSLYRRDTEVHEEEGPLPVLPTRSQIIAHLNSGVTCDLIILGGGLAGVTVAREAALRGSDVLLVEPGYFGERRWSWQDGLVRVLENVPTSLFRTLREARHVMKVVAPHLVSTVPWRESYPRGVWGRFVVWVSQQEWRAPSAQDTSPVFPMVDERLLVRETTLAARQEGALVMAAATAAYVERGVDAGGFRVGVKDLLNSESVEVKGRALFVDPTFPDRVASRLGTPHLKTTPGTTGRPHVFHRAGLITSEERVPWDIYALLPRILSRVPSCGAARTSRRPLPGEWRPGEREAFVAAALSAGLEDSTIESVIQRWRRRARYILQLENGCEAVSPGVLRGEIALAGESDHVCSLEDLVYGALAFQTAPDAEALARLSEVFSGLRASWG